MVSKVILNIKILLLTCFFICLTLSACTDKPAHNLDEQKRHHFAFDNNSYLLVKSYLEKNYHKRKLYNLSHDSLVSLIHDIYPKSSGKKIDDTTLLTTYFEQLDKSTCAGINHLSLWRNTNSPKILSLNEKVSIDTFVHHFNKNLILNFQNNNVELKDVKIEINIVFSYCSVQKVNIIALSEIDSDIQNEFYRIVYTNPKWTLDKVEATQAEADSNDYVRDKNLKINLEIKNTKISKVEYISDSLNINLQP